MTEPQGTEAPIGVIGLGYVGLPLGVAFAEAGVRAIGFDIDPDKPEAIARGESYLRHIDSARVAAATGSGLFEATGDMDRLAECAAILICVPTPLSKGARPDLSFVVDTAETIAARLRPGMLVVLESTTWPGTTTEVLKPILERGGLRVGEDIFLAFSPERENPGDPVYSTAQIPKVVGADDAASRERAVALYQRLVPQVVPVSSSAAAEAAKLTENVFRAVNIALVNELKLVYDAMGIDVWEVLDAADTKPFGFMKFQPGPGLGGHCIPIDPFYLAWKAREHGRPTRFIELAGEINTAMPAHVVEVLARALDARFGKGLNGARVLVLGLAYKKNVDDTRESPALRLMTLLGARGAEVAYHDPFVPVIPRTREHAALAGVASAALDPAAHDVVLIATDHDGIDYAALAREAALVIDTRNACARAGADMTRVVRA